MATERDLKWATELAAILSSHQTSGGNVFGDDALCWFRSVVEDLIAEILDDAGLHTTRVIYDECRKEWDNCV